MPFDRLIGIVDLLAAQSGEPFVAQIGDGAYVPEHMQWQRFIEPVEFDQLLKQARLIISHAGIGTVLNARKVQKPVILFPREAARGEHRNDHQMATIGALEGREGVYIARTAEDMATLVSRDLVPPGEALLDPSHEALLNAVVTYIRELGHGRR